MPPGQWGNPMVEIPTSCITCGKLIPYGKSRCKDHGAAWSGVPKARQAAYRDPVYLKNRARLLAGSPTCAFPGCLAKADTADHVRPVSSGGGNEISNLRPMCRLHNQLLGAQLGGRVTKLRRRKK